MSILGKHLGHELLVKDSGTVRCVTCDHTLDLRSTGSTSTSSFTPTNVNDPTRCPMHLDAPPCRGCAANNKQAREVRTVGPSAQAVETNRRGLAAVRAALNASKEIA